MIAGLTAEVVSGGVENKDVFVAASRDGFTAAPETTSGGRHAGTELCRVLLSAMKSCAVLK